MKKLVFGAALLLVIGAASASAAGGAPADDPELNRYHDQIEREVEKLD